MKVSQEEKPTFFEDSIIVGILLAKNHKVIPKIDERKRVFYSVDGDVKKSIEEIYANSPIGSLDVLRAIKNTRSMIFHLKGGQ